MQIFSLMPRGIVLATALHPLLCKRYGCAIVYNSGFAGTESANWRMPNARTGMITHDDNIAAFAGNLCSITWHNSNN